MTEDKKTHALLIYHGENWVSWVRLQRYLKELPLLFLFFHVKLPKDLLQVWLEAHKSGIPSVNSKTTKHWNLNVQIS